MNTELEQKTCLTHELLAHTHTTKRRANKKKCHPLSNDALIESRSAPPSRSLAHSLTQRTTLTRNQAEREEKKIANTHSHSRAHTLRLHSHRRKLEMKNLHQRGEKSWPAATGGKNGPNFALQFGPLSTVGVTKFQHFYAPHTTSYPLTLVIVSQSDPEPFEKLAASERTERSC